MKISKSAQARIRNLREMVYSYSKQIAAMEAEPEKFPAHKIEELKGIRVSAENQIKFLSGL